jgi:hypothetical protein
MRNASSAGCASFALALRRIPLAGGNSRLSCSGDFIQLAIPVVGPGRRPVSRSAYFNHWFSVCAVQPIWAEGDRIVAHREGCCAL